VLCLSILAIAGLPSDAAGQLGKLKKALGKKATESACVPDRPPTIISTVSLTAAQMAAINAGLDAELKAAPALFAQADEDQKKADQAMKDYEKAREAYDKAHGKWQTCADKVREEDNAKAEELGNKSEAASAKMQGEIDEQAMQDLAQRAAAAAERVSQGKGTAEDRATMAQFQAMMSGVSAANSQVAAAQQEAATHNSQSSGREEKVCGPEPQQPTQPEAAQLPGQKIRAAGAEAAKMSQDEYHIGRETLIALAMSNSVVKGSGGGGGGAGGQSSASPSGPPSDGEAEAMNEQIKATAGKICEMNKAHVPLF
jgi:hypothetical protein